ncbi:MAG: hypothetical protein AAF206_24200 [Bacteroidota bacterium]
MKLSTILLSLLLPLTAFGQFSTTNFSIQAGYQVKNLNPRALNFVINRYNANRTNESLQLGTFRWTSGLFFAGSIKRGRTEFRLSVMTNRAQQTGIAPDSMGVSQRRDLRLSGLRYGIGFVSELIPIGDYVSINVGAQLTLNTLEVETAEVPESSFDVNAELNLIEDYLNPSFTIQAPIRIKPTEQFHISIEPYYQLYFGPTSFQSTNQAINPRTFAADPVTSVEQDLDHLGFNLVAIFYFRRP